MDRHSLRPLYILFCPPFFLYYLNYSWKVDFTPLNLVRFGQKKLWALRETLDTTLSQLFVYCIGFRLKQFLHSLVYARRTVYVMHIIQCHPKSHAQHNVKALQMHKDLQYSLA
jgi:hypothetical protein